MRAVPNVHRDAEQFLHPREDGVQRKEEALATCTAYTIEILRTADRTSIGKAVRDVAGWAPRYVWILRVPILGAAALIWLPTFGFRPTFRPYVSGLFDPISEWALVLITSLAIFNAWTIMIVVGLILTYGEDRFGLPPTNLKVFPAPWYWWLSSAVLVAGPVIARSITYSSVLAGFAWLLPFLTGLGVAAVLSSLAVLISRRSRRAPRDSLYERFLARLSKYPFWAAGFIERTPDGCQALRTGHGFAFGLACSSIGLYVATGLLTQDLQRPFLASALAYVLLLVLMLTWLSGFLAFLFDYIRVPLVLLLTMWIFIVTYGLDYISSTDHIYRTVPLPGDAPPLEDLPHLLEGTRTPIVVAVSGGGIQAAAWTARVMTALDGLDGFRINVRLVSAVSGGSVGTMNLLASWPNCGPTIDASRPPAAFDPNAVSRESSLHAVGWGLAFKDLPRSVVPFFSSPYVDRGSALEDALKREPRLQRAFPDPAPFLSSWRKGVADHLCAGVVFNAMVAETGEPMLFSTVALPDTLAPFSFYRHYQGRDLPMATAVRLSAAFPYVSPASRADSDGGTRGYSHLVDGGYFDNYGVGTLAAITDAALGAEAPARGRHLLVVEICDAAQCSGQPPPKEPSPGKDRRAWPFQITAPFSALVGMRSVAQRVTNRTTIGLLSQDWRAKSTCIETVHVPFGSDDAPMSWHLTLDEKRSVDAAWLRLNGSRGIIDAVRSYLQGGAATPEGKSCMAEMSLAGRAP